MFEITVIIPVYNEEKFVARAIKSTLKLKEVTEIIIVDDGSTDNSHNICRAFEKENHKIKFLQHEKQKNKGAAASRNLGIKNAQNELIAFLDADDYYLPDRFKLDKELFLKNEQLDGVYHAIDPVAEDMDGEVRLQRFKKNQLLLSVHENIEPEKLFYNLTPIGSKGYFYLNGLTVKKSALLQVGLFHENLRLSQDTHLSIKLAAKCMLAPGQISKPVALYALHKNNRSQYTNQIMAIRPFLYSDLFLWAVNENLANDKIYILWKKYYKAACENGEGLISKNKMIILLLLNKPRLFLLWLFKNQVHKMRR